MHGQPYRFHVSVPSHRKQTCQHSAYLLIPHYVILDKQIGRPCATAEGPCSKSLRTANGKGKVAVEFMLMFVSILVTYCAYAEPGHHRHQSQVSAHGLKETPSLTNVQGNKAA